MNNIQKENWAKEFDKEFPNFNGGQKAIKQLVKSFIQSSIDKAVREDRERIVKEIEEKFKNMCFFDGNKMQTMEFTPILKDIINIITNISSPSEESN